jgi:hypothetical protein
MSTAAAIASWRRQIDEIDRAIADFPPYPPTRYRNISLRQSGAMRPTPSVSSQKNDNDAQ